MTDQQQRKQRQPVDPYKKIEAEKRHINTTGIIIAVCVMLVIGIADTFRLFDLWVWLFSASPWHNNVDVATSVFVGLTFLAAGVFAIYSAKQNQ